VVGAAVAWGLAGHQLAGGKKLFSFASFVSLGLGFLSFLFVVLFFHFFRY